MRLIELFKKLISLSIMIFFTLTLPLGPFSPQVYAEQTVSLVIPKDLGSIEHAYQGIRSDSLIYYIQDAHSSLEAQENIAKIVSYLVKERGIKSVYVEGYEGEMPLDSLFPITDKWKKERVAYFLMDYLRLGGAEYAFLNRNQDFKIIGIEELSHYKANLEVYRNSSKNRETISKDLAEVSKYLKILADKLYPKEIQEYQKLKESFETKKISLGAYLFRLMKVASSKQQAANENMRPAPHSLLPEQYPRFSLVSRYLMQNQLSKPEQAELNEKLKAIDPKTFFSDLKQFENDFVARFLTDSAAQKIFQYQRTLELLTKLNTLTLMPEEYTELQSRHLSTELVASFLSRNLKRSIVLHNEWEGFIKEDFEFYRLAQLRDKDFQMNLKLDSPSIVITGGFHKDRLTQYLEEKGVSYILISPRISKEDPKHGARYDFLMSGKYYTHEKPFMSKVSAVKPEGVAVLALDGFNVSKETLALTSSLEKDGSVNVKKIIAVTETTKVLKEVETAKAASLGQAPEQAVGVEKDYQEKLEPLTKVPWGKLPQETQDVISQLGITSDLIEIAKGSGKNARSLVESDLPVLKKTFTPDELKTYWPDLVELIRVRGDKADILLQYDLPALKKVFTPEEFKAYWPVIVALGKAYGEDADSLFQYGLFTFKDLIKTREDLTTIGQDLGELSKESAKNAWSLFRYGLPSLRKLYSDPDDFKRDWNDWKGKLLKLVKITTDYNRERIIRLIFEEPKILSIVQSKGGDPMKHFDFYLKAIERYRRLSVQVLEGIFEAIQEGAISISLLQEEEGRIFRFVDLTNGFSPSLYGIYLKEGEESLRKIQDLSEKVLRDELSPEDINDYETALNSQGYPGKELTLAAVQIAIPSTGTSFIKREEVMERFEKYREEGDRRSDIPEPLRGPPDKPSENAIVYDASFTQIKYRPHEGKFLDPEGKAAKLLSSLRYSNSGKPKEEVEKVRQKDKKAFIQALKDYFNARIEQSRSVQDDKLKAQEAFYSYVSHNDVLTEKIDRIQILDYETLDLLLQFFTDKSILPIIFQEILDKEIAPELLLEKGRGSIRNPDQVLKQVQDIWQSQNLTQEEKLLRFESILKNFSEEELLGKLLPLIQDLKFKEALNSLIQGELKTEVSHHLLTKEFFKEPVETIQEEKAKFKAITLSNAIKIEFRIGKGAPWGLSHLCIGSCLGTDLELWKKKEFFLMAMIDKKAEQTVGFVYLFATSVDNQKVLVIPSIEPSTEFLGEVKAKDLYPEIIRAIQKVAQKGKYQRIFLPIHSNLLSNRTEIKRLAEKQGYPKLVLPESIQWNTVPEPYPIHEVYELDVAEGIAPARAEGKSLGAHPLNLAVLDDLVKPVNAWIDYRDIGNLSLAQINEIYKLAFRNPKKLSIVVYGAPSTDKMSLFDLPNIIFTPKNGVESIALVPKLKNNIHLSRRFAPSSQLEKIVKDQFRYQTEENGLFGVALLYSQTDHREKFLEWYGLRRVGKFFSLINETVLKLVQENEGHLTISRAA